MKKPNSIKALAISAITVVAVSLGGAAVAADIEAGEKIFRKCKVCHFITNDTHKNGPNLAGVFGRVAGTLEGYDRYSDAMKASGITWDDETLNKFLTRPKAFVRGTRMTFIGLRKKKDRDNVIAYLKQFSDN